MIFYEDMTQVTNFNVYSNLDNGDDISVMTLHSAFPASVTHQDSFYTPFQADEGKAIVDLVNECHSFQDPLLSKEDEEYVLEKGGNESNYTPLGSKRYCSQTYSDTGTVHSSIIHEILKVPTMVKRKSSFTRY